MVTGFVFKRLMHYVAGVPRGVGMFVAIDQNLVERLIEYRAKRPYLVGMICLTGAPVDVVYVKRDIRTVGESAYRPWDRLRVGLVALAECLKWRIFPTTRETLKSPSVRIGD